MRNALPQQLVDLLGQPAVLPPDRLADFAVDGLVPRVVVQPDTREGIARVLRWAAQEGLAVSPRGGGTKLSLGNRPQRLDLVLDLSRYCRVLDFQPADLTATVETGITLASLQQELAGGDKFVPLESPLAHRATVGGTLAASASGPLRYAYGLAREWLIGVSVIDADGVATRAGGRVVKNVTGYDLDKLYTGSLGTLGVIVEATFKLAPLPAASGALLASFPSVREGIDASRDLLAQVFAPQGAQVIGGPAVAALAPTGAATGEALVLACYTGRPRALQRRVAESRQLLLERGAGRVEVLEAAEGDRWLRVLTDLGWSDETRPQLHLKVQLPPSRLGQLVESAQRTGPAGAAPGLVADPGFGALQLLWWPESSAGPVDTPGSAPAWSMEQIIATIEAVRQQARPLGGTTVVVHCPGPVKQQIDVWGEPPGSWEVMRRLKQSFDPAGRLNPGRFMGGL